MKTAALALLLLLFTPAFLAAKTITAASGNPHDVQAAINSASAGDTVLIPAGTFSWSSGVTVSKAIHLYGDKNGGTKINVPNGTFDAIAATEPHDGNLDIGYLNGDYQKNSSTVTFWLETFPSNPRGTGRILVHDGTFTNNYAYDFEWDTNGGVVWNCTFDGTNSGGVTGISFVCRDLAASWKTPSTLGTLDKDGLANTYIEDCTFKNAPIGATNNDDDSRVVYRHLKVENAQLASHGQESSPDGTRQFEVSDCTFTCDQDNKWNMNAYVGVRGGTGVICDNSMQPMPWEKKAVHLVVQSTRRRTSIPCQVDYPAARQVGQGWKGEGGYSYPSVPADGTGYFLDPLYIWNNSGKCEVYLNQYEPDECGNNQLITKYLQKDRDYIEGSPKPGFTKYPYPHPLRASVGGGPTPTPTATPAPTITPTPTPQPTVTPPTSPSPTPPPSPSSAFSQWYDELANWIKTHPPTPNK